MLRWSAPSSTGPTPVLVRALAAVVAAVVLGSPAAPAGSAVAADGPQPPVPSPSALPSVPPQPPVPSPQPLPPGTTTAADASAPGATTATSDASARPAASAGSGTVESVESVGALLGAFVLPALAHLDSAARSASAPGAQGAASLEPGGGSAASPESWAPKAPVRVPVAPPASDSPAPLTPQQILWTAYVSAADREKACRISPLLLAAIGEVESSSLRGRTLDPFHDVQPPVVGPALTGGSYARIHDSDGGALDGDPRWDHAVGPMQFIPATWRLWGADGSGDGEANPQNVEDAALAAARYLCAGGRDLSRDADRRAAVRSYNHSDRYVATVLGLYASSASGGR